MLVGWATRRQEEATNSLMQDAHEVASQEFREEPSTIQSLYRDEIERSNRNKDRLENELSAQVQVAPKTKPKYQCHICQAGPFKWKTMKSHAISTHHIASKDMKTEQWCYPARANDAKLAVGGLDINQHTHQVSKSKKVPSAQEKVAPKTIPTYQCRICHAGPFTWKTMMSHAASTHNIPSEDTLKVALYVQSYYSTCS